MIAHRNKYSLGKSIPVKITTVVEHVRTTDDGSRYLCIVVHDIEMSIRQSETARNGTCTWQWMDDSTPVASWCGLNVKSSGS